MRERACVLICFGYVVSYSIARRLLLGPQHQPRYSPTALHIRLEDLVDVGGIAIAVPDPFGIDHHRRSELAAIEAAGGVYARIGEAELLGAHFHVVAQLLAALLGTAA